jgi:glutamine synthetase
VEGSAYRLAHTLPRTLYESLENFTGSKSVKKALGEKFVEAVKIVKETELQAYQQVISSWEREHLLLNV